MHFATSTTTKTKYVYLCFDNVSTSNQKFSSINSFVLVPTRSDPYQLFLRKTDVETVMWLNWRGQAQPLMHYWKWEFVPD